MRASSAVIPALVVAAVLSTSAVKPAEYVRISPAFTGPAARAEPFSPLLSCDLSALRWSDQQLRPPWSASAVHSGVCGGGGEPALGDGAAQRQRLLPVQR